MQLAGSILTVQLRYFPLVVFIVSMHYARRLDKLKLRQQITLCGRGGAARTDALEHGLAPAIPEDGGMPILVAQQLSRAEAVTDKVTLLEKSYSSIFSICVNKMAPKWQFWANYQLSRVTKASMAVMVYGNDKYKCNYCIPSRSNRIGDPMALLCSAVKSTE